MHGLLQRQRDVGDGFSGGSGESLADKFGAVPKEDRKGAFQRYYVPPVLQRQQSGVECLFRLLDKVGGVITR